MEKFKALRERIRSVQYGLLIVVVFTIGFLMGNLTNITAASQISLSTEEEAEFAAFWEAYDLLRDRYLDPLDTHTVVEGAIAGMLEATGDQYTGYMFSEVYSLLDEDISGEIQGIGVVIRTNPDNGLIEVANVMRDTPAQEAGVQVGDFFIEVDGEDVIGYTQLELAGVVRGPRGSLVDIVFLRDEEEVELSIERDRIPIPTVEFAVLEDEIGFIRMFEFNAQSRPQFEAALSEINADELEGLIIDLRGNPGGTLDSAIDMTSAFLPEENGLILREEFANGRTDTLRSNGDYLGLEIPIVILVDETSASASELMSGALQDTDNATIIGETSFGKGTVQIWQGLSNGGGVRITIARWLTPDGNWIHEEGINPDLTIDWDPEGGYLLDVNDEESLAGDPQLQAAVDFLQGREVEEIPEPVEEADATIEEGADLFDEDATEEPATE
ncbi:MAG: S41 family peptidase [Chloroflexota bacterium]